MEPLWDHVDKSECDGDVTHRLQLYESLIPMKNNKWYVSEDPDLHKKNLGAHVSHVFTVTVQ